MRKIRLLIVDDAVIVRQKLSEILSQDPFLDVAGIATNGQIALSLGAHNYVTKLTKRGTGEAVSDYLKRELIPNIKVFCAVFWFTRSLSL